jgi:hypothetical protein
MNVAELRAEFCRNGKSLGDVSKALGINRASLWRRLNGSVDFNRKEIVMLINFLCLDPDKIMYIFFDQKVA